MTKKVTKPMKAIIACTNVEGGKGVYFGYVPENQDLTASTIRLERARACVWFSRSIKGAFGLGSTGPDEQCRISPACPSFTAQGVVGVMECTPEAVSAWEAAPWAN